MSEKITPGPLCGRNHDFKEAVCIQTDKIYDSCRDKDCIENARVFLTGCGQELVDKAINVKVRKAEVIWVFSDIEPVPFNDGFFTIDIKFFFKITLDVFLGISKPVPVEGLATFDKKVILFGSEGKAKKFTSKFRDDAFDQQMWKKTNLPEAVVEVVDPIALAAKLVEVRDCCCDDDDKCCKTISHDISGLPECVCNAFDDAFSVGDEEKRVFVTLGLFSIIKLEREVQLLIPAFDFCFPHKECIGSSEEDPCCLFSKIKFPFDEFFPPQICDFLAGEEGLFEDNKKCGCK